MIRRNTKHAFTMIELVFVIIILGILAALAIPNLVDAKDDATAKVEIGNLKAIQSSYSVVYGQNKGSISEMSVAIGDSIKANIGSELETFSEYHFGQTVEDATGNNAVWVFVGIDSTNADRVSIFRKSITNINNTFDKTEDLASTILSDSTGLVKFNKTCTGASDCYLTYYVFDGGIRSTDADWMPTDVTYNAPATGALGHTVTTYAAFSNL